MIEPDTVKANGIEKIPVGGHIYELVRVRLEVMIHDIWSVAEFIDEQQHDLLLDPETLSSRLGNSQIDPSSLDPLERAASDPNRRALESGPPNPALRIA